MIDFIRTNTMYLFTEHYSRIICLYVANKVNTPNVLQRLYYVSLQGAFGVAENNIQAIFTAYGSNAFRYEIIVKEGLSASRCTALDIPSVVATIPKLLLFIRQTIQQVYPPRQSPCQALPIHLHSRFVYPHPTTYSNAPNRPNFRF